MEEKIFKYFFSFFLSVAMETRIMIESKFRSVSFVSPPPRMLLVKFRKIPPGRFGGEDVYVIVDDARRTTHDTRRRTTDTGPPQYLTLALCAR